MSPRPKDDQAAAAPIEASASIEIMQASKAAALKTPDTKRRPRKQAEPGPPAETSVTPQKSVGLLASDPHTPAKRVYETSKLGSTAKYKGVAWHDLTGKWKAAYKGLYLGVYETEEEAAEARWQYERNTDAPVVETSISQLLSGEKPAKPERRDDQAPPAKRPATESRAPKAPKQAPPRTTANDAKSSFSELFAVAQSKPARSLFVQQPAAAKQASSKAKLAAAEKPPVAKQLAPAKPPAAKPLATKAQVAAAKATAPLDDATMAELRAKMPKLAAATPEEEAMMPRWLRTFNSWMVSQQSLSDKTAKTYIYVIRCLFLADRRSPSAMASQEYRELAKLPREGLSTNGHHRTSSASRWIAFFNDHASKGGSLEEASDAAIYQIRTPEQFESRKRQQQPRHQQRGGEPASKRQCKHSANLAEAAVGDATTAAVAGQAPSTWKVVAGHAVNVRGSTNLDAEVLCQKQPDEQIRGIQVGEWLELSGEQGFMVIAGRVSGTQFLQRCGPAEVGDAAAEDVAGQESPAGAVGVVAEEVGDAAAEDAAGQESPAGAVGVVAEEAAQDEKAEEAAGPAPPARTDAAASDETAQGAKAEEAAGPAPLARTDAAASDETAQGANVEERDEEMEKGVPKRILFSGCAAQPQLNGVYERTEEFEEYLEHDRHSYKKVEAVNGDSYFVYYWQDDDEPEACGWYIATEVGSEEILGKNRSSNDSKTPPDAGHWQIQGDDLKVEAECGYGNVVRKKQAGDAAAEEVAGRASPAGAEGAHADDTAPDAKAEDLSQEWHVGSSGVLTGLQAAPELNGLPCHLVSFDEERGRWSVEVVIDGKPCIKNLKPANLARLEAKDAAELAPSAECLGADSCEDQRDANAEKATVPSEPVAVFTE